MKKLLIAAAGLLSAMCLLGQGVISGPQYPDVQQELGIVIPMRDQIRLAADVFLPKGTGRWPTILVRTPYNRKSVGVAGYPFYAEHGYAVVIQDVRGRNASQGVFGHVDQEGADGNDTIDWISEQPWSNGRVAMAGASYLGVVQWWAATEDNPHLVTIVPIFSGDDEYTDRFYSTGGAVKLGHRLLWLSENLTPPNEVRPVFGSYIAGLPLRNLDLAAAKTVIPAWRRDLSHPSFDDYWKSLSVRERLDRVNIPVLSIGGWFDNYAESDLDAFSRLNKRKAVIETWIGPTGHNPAFRFPTRDFGTQAMLPVRTMQLNWFDSWMKHSNITEHLQSQAAPLHLFVMGANVWREEHEWPLARTRFTPLYLTSDGHANTRQGDGELTWRHPGGKEPVDQFTYDPKNPVPTIGGAVCCNAKILPPGPLDQSPVEGRKDVLVYTSAALSEEMEVTGPVRVVLYIATSVNDTDFTAKLIDVQPGGQPLLVTDGIQRLRYRLSLSTPVFVKRDTAYQISVDAGVTSYVFAPGHRIRLEVSSSNFPRFDRNLNTPALFADETKTVKAKQTIYHEKGYQSAIILPVIPKPAEPRHLRRSPDERPSALARP